MAPAGEDAEELTLQSESDRMVRGTLGHMMQHRVVAVHSERRDYRSGGARNAPRRQCLQLSTIPWSLPPALLPLSLPL